MKNDGGVNIVLCGRGGQGILFATTVLEKTALRMGHDVIGSETHGMAQRGGSVVSHLKVGSSGGPLVAAGEADLLLSLERTETYRNLPFLRKGGTCLANFPSGADVDPQVAGALSGAGIALHAFDADAVARGQGSPQAANVALLGLLAAWPASPFPKSALAEAVTAASAERFRAKNAAVFEEAVLCARETLFPEGS